MLAAIRSEFPSPTTRALLWIVPCAAFFLSGAAALIFEGLWFRLAGLTLGNSLWASSLVLSAFMGGLACGNGMAARWGQRARHPLRLYAQIELVVAATGVALVLLLPLTTRLLAPFFAAIVAWPWVVNALRAVVAFVLLLIPTTAMGATLPLLAQVLSRHDALFGRVLGRLYGWNTLGGVAGALFGELYLVVQLGQRRVAVCAALLNVAAAVCVLAVRQLVANADAGAPSEPALERLPSDQPGVARSLIAAGAAGAILLALEVVWFRLLLLFVYGTAHAFAIMLAVILLGIGAGGLAAAATASRIGRSSNEVSYVALGSSLATAATYWSLDPHPGAAAHYSNHALSIAWLAVRLMLPTCILSGVLFTLLGRAVRDRVQTEARAAGLLTLSNTLGGVVGALCGGFVLLPALGIERSLFAAALAYMAVAWLACEPQPPRLLRLRGLLAATAVVGLVLALFPFGLMRNRFVRASLGPYLGPGTRLAAFREGLTETDAYVVTDWGGEPWAYQLITNGHSMSATGFYGRRYMKQYVYWALAVNPAIRKALLVCYGAGSTAKALTDTRALESIDVVDISRDILELSSVVYPDPRANPLNDPRVRKHVEDGRFFLQTTSERFDLITAEPPPPKGAGIASLYSREYFDLVSARLRPNGIVTYWLPVEQLRLGEARAIVAAFCGAFPDCSLWTGSGYDWMLAGTRGLSGPAPEREFVRQWSDPVVSEEMSKLGFERPEQLGATFIADAATLRTWVDDARPLCDDAPGMLSPRPPDGSDQRAFRQLMDAGGARVRFAASAFISRAWPAALRARTLDFFEYQRVFDDDFDVVRERRVPDLADVLAHSTLRTLPLLLLDSDRDLPTRAQRALSQGVRDANVLFQAGAGELAERRYLTAARLFGEASERNAPVEGAYLYQALALALLGEREQARSVLTRHARDSGPDWVLASRDWLGQYVGGPGVSARRTK